MAFARANSDFISETGEYYEAGLGELAARHAVVIEKVEGRRHLASLFFRDTQKLTRFVAALTQGGSTSACRATRPSAHPPA